MSLCDRCTAGAGCCLDYLDAACKRYRDRECPDVQPTNADRIRAMNDNKLAEYFAKTFCYGYGQPQLLDWLKQPALEEGEFVLDSLRGALCTHTKQLNAAKKALKLAASGHCCLICGRDCIGGGVTACSAFEWDGTCNAKGGGS